ncbi:Ig-like domain-containing protein, partial [Leeuwenhoekiella parthenopeia]
TDGTPLQVTIPAGSTTSEPIVFPTVDDNIFEPSENFTVTGTVSTGTVSNSPVTASGTITDNDGNAPAISIADVTVSEGDDAEFVVTLDKPSFEDIVVDITFADGSATNPEDYTDGTPLQVTIPAGSTTSEPIVFPTVDDNIFESSENFTVTGTVSTGTVSNSPVTASGTITDNDGNAPAISIADVTVSEGDDAEFVVTLDKPSFEDIVVDITFADGSATNPEDYTDGTPLQVTIPAGSTTSEPIVFPTVDDNIFEPSENFTVTGTVSTGTVSNSPVTASGTITDNDGNAPAISIADVTVSEGDDAEFVVTLDKPSFEDIVVDITFADGSATNPEDYTDGTPLQVTIPAGSTTSEPIVFPTVDDNIFEPSENFTVTGTVSTGTVSNSPVTASGTITDNDGNAPAISIADVTVSEGDDAEFVVTLDKPSFEDIVVDITFADGSATNPEDYTDGTPLQVTIPAGSTTSEPIVFPTVDDTAFEDDETFTVIATVSLGTTVNPSDSATGTIESNEILAINDINDTFEGQAVSGDVGTNDENPDGPAGSEVYTVVTQPTNGTLVFNADGTYTYTPNDGFIGQDSFTYEVCDGGSPRACDQADVVIQVLPIGGPENAAPVANDDTAITETGVPVDGNVLVNDFDPDGDAITVTGNSQPANGTVTVNPDGSFTYTPEPGFVGEDSFTYTVCDSGNPALCSEGRVTIEVVADTANIVVANDDAYFGFIGDAIEGNVLTNDSDPEGDSFTVTGNTAPSNGTVAIGTDGRFTYTPDMGYSGTDTFTYTITDAQGATDTATVYISIDPSPNGGNDILAINDINDTFEGQAVSGDVGTNDENPDGPAGSEVYTVVTQPTNGTLVFNADGTYTYTPNDGF